MVRSCGCLRRVWRCPRSVRWIAAVTMAMAVTMPLTAAAGDPGRARDASAAARGVIYGGVTPQDWPVVVEISKDKRRVVRAVIGLTLTCTPSGLIVRIADGYQNLPLSKNGRFSDSFGPNQISNPDGTTTDVQGSVTGTTNAKRTKMSGTWQLTAVDHDAAGVVTDTCDSGKVAWTAKQ
jgi:hypothetical protein